MALDDLLKPEGEAGDAASPVGDDPREQAAMNFAEAVAKKDAKGILAALDEIYLGMGESDEDEMPMDMGSMGMMGG